SVAVSNRAWVITVRLSGNRDFDDFIYGCDGDSVAEHIQYALKPGLERPNDGVMVIQPGEAPEARHSTFAELVWFACASQKYLSARTTNRLPPLWSAPTSEELAAKWSTRNAAPFLPDRATFYGVNTNDVRAIFAASSFSNVGGLSLPIGFSIERYSRHEGDAAGSSALILKASATVTNIVLGAGPSVVKARTATRNIYVQDGRPIPGAATNLASSSREYFIAPNESPPASGALMFQFPARIAQGVWETTNNLSGSMKMQ